METEVPVKKRNYLKYLVTLLIILTLVIALIPLYVYFQTKSSIKTSLEGLESRKVGIVFGASVRPDKTPSDMLRDRLDTAYELYSSGKISYILVTGDNSTKKYNEPSVMYNYLLKQGVPKEFVIRDFAGLRTYDSCIRAKSLWNVNKAILITQKYHLYRAVYTCEKLGIDSIGFSATKHNYIIENTYRVREYFAILKGFIDLNILKPNYIGGKIEGDLSE